MTGLLETTLRVDGLGIATLDGTMEHVSSA